MISKFFFSPANHGIHKKLQTSSNIKLTNLKKIKSDHRACITFLYYKYQKSTMSEDITEMKQFNN